MQERFYPAALGIIAALASLRLPGSVQVDIAKDLANPIVSILAITVGFIAAAIAILLSTNMATLEIFKTGNRFNRLVDFHWEAIVSGMVAAVLSLTVIVACKRSEGELGTWFQVGIFHLWVACVVWAFAAFFRVVHLLRMLLRL